MASTMLLLSFLVGGLLLNPASGLYSQDGPVRLLSEEEYISEVLEGPDMWLVEYFKSDCQPCMQVVPEFVKLGHNLNGIIKVGAVDCDKDRNICVMAKLQSLPALKLFSWERKKNPYTGKYYKEDPKDYKGRSNSKMMGEFATDDLPTKFVTLLSSSAPSKDGASSPIGDGHVSSSASEFLSSHPSLPKVLLFSRKDSVTPLYKGLSLRFRGRMAFAQASSSDAELTSQFNVTQFPSLRVIHSNGEQTTLYEGSLKAVQISEFLEPLAAPSPAGDDERPSGDAAKGGDEELKAPQKAQFIEEFSVQKFQKMLANEEVWLVAFVGGSGGKCEERKEEWERAATSLISMVHMGELNISSEAGAEALAEQYGVKSQVQDPNICLAILLFPFGDDKSESEPEVYTGPVEGKALSAFALAEIPSFVQHLTNDNMQSFVNIQPKMGKVVLISAKTETPSMFKTLAANFRQNLMFGQVHSSEETLLKRLGVEKVPHVLVLVQVANKDTGRQEIQAQHYGGPLNYPNLAYFFNQIASVQQRSEAAPFADESSVADVALVEVSSQEKFNSVCVSGRRVCMIGFFDGLSTEAEDHQTRFSQFASGSAARQFSIGWVDVSKFPSFALKFGIVKANVPTAVVFSAQKMRYAQLTEGYGIQSLNNLLSGVLSGKIRTNVLEELPSFKESVEEEQVLEQVTEEEFSLDDILNEEVEGTDVMGVKSDRLREVEKKLEEEAAARKAEEEAAANAEREAAATAAKAQKNKKNKKKKKKTTTTKASEASKKDEL